MSAVGRDVGDGVELAPGEGLLEVPEGVGDPVAVAEVARPRLVDVDAGDDLRLGIGLKGAHVMRGHVPRAENEKPCL